MLKGRINSSVEYLTCNQVVRGFNSPIRLILLSFLFFVWLYQYANNQDSPILPEPAYVKYIPQMLLVESNNQHRRNGKVLVSSRGAVGRWQVRPIAARECRRLNGWPRRPSLDIYNERTNEMVGRWYLGYCWELSGKNLRLTFNYYNLGPTAGKKRYNYQHVNKILMIK